ncbi:MAG: hypothetical protein WA951_14050 [Leeuwenhoekiella sp.]
MVETAEAQEVGLKEFYEVRQYMGSGNRMLKYILIVLAHSVFSNSAKCFEKK